jgi:hypothetical protein
VQLKSPETKGMLLVLGVGSNPEAVVASVLRAVLLGIGYPAACLNGLSKSAMVSLICLKSIFDFWVLDTLGA